VFLLVLTSVSAAAASGAYSPASCDEAPRFDGRNFTHPIKINNKWMPLVPGTQFVYEGFITPPGGGSTPVDHQVIFTVTDLTKVIGGVRTRVMYDVDVNEGEVVEAELAFFAQDEDGNVWNLGEYPEEYEGGEFVGASSTWITGEAGAKAGVHMFAQPQRRVGKPSYRQGLAPKIDFLDCAQVVDKGQSVNGYENVLVTNEWSPLEPDSGIQVKYHAPTVGIVQIGAIGDPEAETLVLTDHTQLSDDEMAQVREEALALDSHAYEVSKVYGKTPPAESRHED
jgi:hypothetical protein